MFSEELIKYAEESFRRRMPLLREKAEEIEAKIGDCSWEEAVLLRFYYGTMPLSDAFCYAFELFKSYACHAVYVRRHMPWCAALTEDMFLHYVAYYRINTEAIADCRSLFRQELAAVTEGLSLAEAALAVNDWCASHASYESTDERTQSPMSVYLSGSGRCGEESAFLVTALRSIGIPARQVYAPRWAHCDDNHAWAEVYVEGDWRFIGACEPEETLDKGWFQGAATRALLVYARIFSDYMPTMREELAGREGGIFYVNVTGRYARLKQAVIHVTDSAGQPAADAAVSVEILNMAELCPIITLHTDKTGTAGLPLGIGDVILRARKDGYEAEAVLKAEEEERTLILEDMQAGMAADSREDVVIKAPAGGQSVGAVYDERQKAANRKRLKETAAARAEWLQHFKNEETERSFPEEASLLRIAAGNLHNIREFLLKGGPEEEDRRAMLHTLSAKDYRDVKAEVLEEHLSYAEQVKAHLRLGTDKEGKVCFGVAEKAVFEKYVLCPRIRYEELTGYRRLITEYFGEEEKIAFRKAPAGIWEYIEREISYIENEDYAALTASPAGSLAGKWAGEMGKKVLFVAVARTLGIPSRIDSAALEAQYWENGAFVTVSDKREKEAGKGRLRLCAEDGKQWKYHQTWTLARWKENGFTTLCYEEAVFENGKLLLTLPAGIYRLTTSSRIPNGSQYANRRTFVLESGAERELTLRVKTAEPADMLVDYPVPEFSLKDEAGNGLAAKELLNGQRNFLLFLEEGREPTEHVLNEMLGEKERFLEGSRAERFRIVFVAASGEALANATLQRVLKEIPGIQVYYDEGLENAEPLARRMYVEPDRLPLLIVTGTEYNGIYISSGYNVGSVDMALKLLLAR